jgi:hypothetical protein
MRFEESGTPAAVTTLSLALAGDVGWHVRPRVDSLQ